MIYDPEIHHRRSLRLQGYDYSQAGAYFVTICVQDRECLFGEIVGAGPRACPEIVLNDLGYLVQSIWLEMPFHYPGVDLDALVVMPNHIHGIVVLTGVDTEPAKVQGHPQGGAPTMALPDVVHRFKSLTTARYRHNVKSRGWPPFAGRLWQRNYYEHVIRNEDDLNAIRQYIADNPTRWALDRENPAFPR